MVRTKKYSEKDKVASNKYSSIKSRTKGTKNDITGWKRKDFIKWFKENSNKCAYCKCTIEELNAFYKLTKTLNKRITRGKTLEVDRLNDEKYSKKNCCLACYWCNNAKTDTFTKEDMEDIGKAIGTIINKRLNQQSNNG